MNRFSIVATRRGAGTFSVHPVVHFLLLFWGLGFVGVRAKADAGFFRTDEAPAAVEKAALATYRYVALNDPPLSVPKSDYGVLVARYKENEFLKRLVSAELRECREKDLESCPISYKESGTAFVTGTSHDRIVTSSHNLDSDKRRYREFLGTPEGRLTHIYVGTDEPTLMRNMRLSFQLYDRNGDVVFDTRREGDFANPEVMGFGEMMNWKKGFHANAESDSAVDFTSIKLSRPVGEVSLDLRKDLAGVGEDLFLIGFPVATRGRISQEHAPDSNGMSQYYSRGKVCKVATVLQFMFGPAFVADPARDAQIAQNILYSDTESLPGFMGGPLLDKDGRVAAILVDQWGMSRKEFYTLNNGITVHSK